MLVHLKNDDVASLECDAVQEGEYGLKLISGSPTRGDVIGYVPYEQLDYVSPSSTDN